MVRVTPSQAILLDSEALFEVVEWLNGASSFAAVVGNPQLDSGPSQNQSPIVTDAKTTPKLKAGQ